MDVGHMTDNLNALTFTLTSSEMTALSSMPQDYCSIDDWYECAH